MINSISNPITKQIYMHMTFEYEINGRCDVKILEHEENDERKAVVLITELLENQGTSVTNAIEYISTSLYFKYLRDIARKNIRWIEYYSEYEVYDGVSFHGDGDSFTYPSWEKIDGKEVKEFFK